MSGTSLDGLDIAHVKFQFSKGYPVHFEILQTETISYQSALLDRLKISTQLNGSDLFELHHVLGLFYAESVNQFIQKNAIAPTQIDAIASHGQTIFHRPELGFTVQLGCGTTLNYHTKIPVINDFRTLDVVAGGQGAPLVPIGDAQLFSSLADGFLNLGGFANISTQKNGLQQAFDIAPANLPLNIWMQTIGQEYDKDGALSSSGKVNETILNQVLQQPFFKQNGPKSLGTEWLNEHYLPLFESLPIEDRLRTHTEILSLLCAETFHSLALHKVFVSGGGAYNSFLMQRIQANFNGELIIPAPQIIAFKEALIFAFLGALFIRKEPNTIASVTGAKESLCTGTLHDYLGVFSRQ
jgi:anhydro-N-acetylmuramic acid kinase